MAWKYETLVSNNKWAQDYLTSGLFADPITLTLNGIHPEGQNYIVVNENLNDTYTGGIFKVPAPISETTLRITIGENYEYYLVDRPSKKLYLTTGLANTKASGTPVILKNRILIPSNIKALIYNDEYNLLNAKIEQRLSALTTGTYEPSLILRYSKDGDNRLTLYYVSIMNRSPGHGGIYAGFVRVVNNVHSAVLASAAASTVTSFFRRVSFEVFGNTLTFKYEEPAGVWNTLLTYLDPTPITTPGFCGIEVGYRGDVTYSVANKLDSIKISEVSA